MSKGKDKGRAEGVTKRRERDAAMKRRIGKSVRSGQKGWVPAVDTVTGREKGTVVGSQSKMKDRAHMMG